MGRPSTLKMMWKGIARRRSRTYATLACFAIITASLLGSSILIGTAGTSVSVSLDRMGADMAVVPQDYATLTNSSGSGSMSMTGGASSLDNLMLFLVKPVNSYLNGSEINQVRAISGVAQASPILVVKATSTTYTQLVGYDSDTDFTILPWAERTIASMKSGEVLVGNLVAINNSSTISLFGSVFNIAGRLDASGTAMDRTVFMKMTDLYTLAASNATLAPNGPLDGKVSAFLLKKEAGVDTDSLATELKTRMPVTSSITPSRFTSNLANQFSGIGSTLALTSLIVAVVVIPQVALVSTMTSNERRGEYGMLRALGGTKRMIFAMVFGETLLIALIGGLVGTAGTGIMFLIIERQLGTAFLGQFLWPSAGAMLMDVISALSIALVVGAISALYPAYISSKREPYDAIKLGGGK